MTKKYEVGRPYPSFVEYQFTPDLTDETNAFHESYNHELYMKALDDAKPPTLSLVEIEEFLLGDVIEFDHDYCEPKYSFMNEFIPGIRFHSAGSFLPFQADGVWGPYEFYYRERSGVATLRLATIGVFPGVSTSLYSASQEVEELRSGPQWINSFLKLWEELKISEDLWVFPCVKINFDWESGDSFTIEADKPDKKHAWGHTLEEAWVNLWVPDSYFTEAGADIAIQKEMLKASGINKETAFPNAVKVYPEVIPNFSLAIPPERRNSSGEPQVLNAEIHRWLESYGGKRKVNHGIF